ncbi:site-specific integrase [Streptosporangium sp. NPDC006013]|uniref:site-specific integrase n=1 Tax=Streptosporangium sp. NPDC006013 TaxID=3155596 RepID=UPI0033B2217F
MLLDERMRPVEPVCGWFRTLADNKQPETMRAYAYIVRRLGEFLAARGTDLLSATEADLVAYRRARTELDDRPIDEVTWDREAVVINSLYGYLIDQGLVRRRPYRMTAAGQRNSLRSSMRREMQIRHMAVEQYLYFRDVGLGGQLPDGSVNEAFRGWAPHRNRAALELALLTGMRLQEWSTLLLPELGEGWRRPGESVEFELQKCAKYEMARTVYVPPAALAMVETYLMLERPDIVEVSAAALARRRDEMFMVTKIDVERGRLHGRWEGRRRSFAISALDPRMRRAAMRETDAGLEPLAVFVGHGGQMLGPSSWDRVRKDAWSRMRAHADQPGVPMLPARPWRFHDARHTFALQLLKYLNRTRVQQEIEQDHARGMVTLSEHVALHPVLTVQRRLGHKRPSSTYAYLRYLEDPMNYVDAAFRQWAEHDGATYADIALRALEADRKEGGDAETR